ncbi:RICIN domain-containing protein [Nostoc sp. FACHB-973]|nr:RICIN domain-containing protein [Nostoc sp. FACHB-973]
MKKSIRCLAKVALLSTMSSIFVTFPLLENATAQSSDSRLRTQFTGSDKCLDIINDGLNNKLTMAACGNFSGQLWSIKPSKYKGYYYLRTQFTGKNKCLDIINDGVNNKTIMATCGNFSGQLWKIEPTQSAGFFRLKTQFTGKNKCLDIINDGVNNKTIMADCGNYSGQFWSLSI